MSRKYYHGFPLTSPSDSARSVTSFHFSHFFCFVRSLENDPKRTLFSCFIFCRTESLFAVAILPLLSSTTRLVTLIVEMVMVTILAKDSVKQDFMLLVTCRSLTSHTRRCVEQAPYLALSPSLEWVPFLLHHYACGQEGKQAAAYRTSITSDRRHLTRLYWHNHLCRNVGAKLLHYAV